MVSEPGCGFHWPRRRVDSKEARSYEGVNELAPEARKNIAPAARPGTKPANVRGPEGRKIDATNLSPLRGWCSDGYEAPGLRPGLGSNGPPGLFVHTFIDRACSAARLSDCRKKMATMVRIGRFDIRHPHSKRSEFVLVTPGRSVFSHSLSTAWSGIQTARTYRRPGYVMALKIAILISLLVILLLFAAPVISALIS